MIDALERSNRIRTNEIREAVENPAPRRFPHSFGDRGSTAAAVATGMLIITLPMKDLECEYAVLGKGAVQEVAAVSRDAGRSVNGLSAGMGAHNPGRHAI